MRMSRVLGNILARKDERDDEDPQHRIEHNTTSATTGDYGIRETIAIISTHLLNHEIQGYPSN